MQRVERTRSGALMRLLECLEVGSGWCFDALHVAGMENTIAYAISRWEPEYIDGNLRAFRPDVAWHRQVLEPTGVALWSVGGHLIRLSVASSSHRAYTSGSRSWAASRGLIGEAEYFDAAVSDTETAASKYSASPINPRDCLLYTSPSPRD